MAAHFLVASSIQHKYNVAAFEPGTLINRYSLQGPLAQLVEQLTLNQRVEGSTPSRLTRNKKGLPSIGSPFLFIWHSAKWRNKLDSF
jgi:hypothetical protein